MEEDGLGVEKEVEEVSEEVSVGEDMLMKVLYAERKTACALMVFFWLALQVL